MDRKVVALCIGQIILISFIGLFLGISQVTEAPTVIFVDDVPGSGGSDNPPEDFTSIQDAINASTNGDTIYVFNGTYSENLIVNKKINITGENRDSTIIDGTGIGTVVRIEVDDVKIMNFTITNAGSDDPWGPYGYEYNSGVEILSDGNDIIGCYFTNIPKVPLFFYGYASQNLVENNIFHGDYMNAIRFTGEDFNYNTFLNNIFLGTSYGMVAYSVMNFDDVLIQRNMFMGTKWNGITLSLTQSYESADRVNIRNNTIIGFEVGLLFRHTYDSIVVSNTFCDNTEIGVHLIDSTNNIIYHNNFINNVIQAIDEQDNNWDDGYPSRGNYWSDFDESAEGAYDDYQGVDQNVLGSDGIVDKGSAAGGGKNPYVIDADSQDYYPLMFPVENNIYLYEGWNLVSTPLIQTEQNLKDVLESIDGHYNAVQWYDCENNNNHWKHHNVCKSYGNDLFELNESKGFWIHITRVGGTIFECNGLNPTSNQTIQLYEGWNMVGYPSLSNHNRTEGLNNLEFGIDVDAIQWFDAATKTWHFMGPDDLFVPGRGYWVHSKVEIVWEVPI